MPCALRSGRAEIQRDDLFPIARVQRRAHQRRRRPRRGIEDLRLRENRRALGRQPRQREIAVLVHDDRLVAGLTAGSRGRSRDAATRTDRS